MTSLSTSPQTTAHPLRDALTQALSRPQFSIMLDEEKQRSDDSASPFVLCLIDIDNLRNINDEFGHRAGDRVLAEVARRIRNRLDEAAWDSVEYLHARFDGDALVLLARDCSVKRGTRLAAALRDAINEERFERGLRVTVSISIAEYRIGESTDSVLARLEKALHLAKQFGADTIEVAPMPESYGPANVVPLPRRRPALSRRRELGNG
jgi:diguanylate cyclase (GGDEF)-like protein